MTIPRIGLTAFVMLWLASGAGAQTTVDVSRLPIDIERIQRELQQSTSREEHEGLNLRYVVEVYGQAPPIVFFGPDDDLVHGPVPDGAPTHREMIEHVTPKEYRTPAADLGALARWLAERAKK
jgi:hypothetical protein